MHEETDLPQTELKACHKTSGDRGVPAVTFGLGVAALVGLVATTGAAASASAAGTDGGQPATIAALSGPHVTCSGTK